VRAAEASPNWIFWHCRLAACRGAGVKIARCTSRNQFGCTYLLQEEAFGGLDRAANPKAPPLPRDQRRTPVPVFAEEIALVV
jgi:hypothetical protein